MDPLSVRLKMGWLLVTFDLPTESKRQRKAASTFRKFLLGDGYNMLQFSVYVRACVSFARQTTHIERLKKNLPEEGKIRAIFVTKAQWDKSFIIHGCSKKRRRAEGLPEQLELW